MRLFELPDNEPINTGNDSIVYSAGDMTLEAHASHFSSYGIDAWYFGEIRRQRMGDPSVEQLLLNISGTALKAMEVRIDEGEEV